MIRPVHRCTVRYMRYEATRSIAAAPSEVYAAISDVDRWPEWLDTVHSVERLDEGPLRIGSRVRIRQPKLPTAVWEVTDVVAGHHFTWEATGPGLRSIGRHVVEPDAAGARVTLGIEQTGPLRWLAALVWGRLTQRYVEREARCLDALVTAPALP